MINFQALTVFPSSLGWNSCEFGAATLQEGVNAVAASLLAAISEQLSQIATQASNVQLLLQPSSSNVSSVNGNNLAFFLQ